MKARLVAAVAASLLATTLAASPAGAQTNITSWVSNGGDNANPCSFDEPCASFGRALDTVSVGGTIRCLDTLNSQSAITVTKSATIDCTEHPVVIRVGASTLTINAPDGIVMLRGFSLGSLSPNTPSVRVTQAAAAHLDNVLIRDSGGPGILVVPTAGLVRLYIGNSIVARNGVVNANPGIRIAPTGAASVQLVLHNVEMVGNYRGIEVAATGTTAGNSLTIRNSMIVGSIENAINADSGANALNIMIEESTITNNVRGIIVSGAGTSIRVGRSNISSNGTAFFAAAGATIRSYRNNQINLNSSNGTPLPQETLQ